MIKRGPSTWIASAAAPKNLQPDWQKGPALLAYRKARTVETLILPMAENGSAVDGFMMQTRFFGPVGEELFRGQ